MSGLSPSSSHILDFKQLKMHSFRNTIIIVLLPLLLYANGNLTNRLEIQSPTTVNVSEITTDWGQVLVKIRQPISTNEMNRHTVELIEGVKTNQNNHWEPLASTPLSIEGFDGNSYVNAYPNDNGIAISNDNIIVSVSNSRIYMCNAITQEVLSEVSLSAFASSLKFTWYKI